MSRTILIIDDSKEERVILSTFFKADYDLIEAESGDAAIEILGTKWRSISAIVLDISTPSMEGFEVLRKIRNNAIYLQIPIIVGLGQNDDKTQVRALSLGATGVFSKPYNKDILLPLIENTISLREVSSLSNALNLDSPSKQEGWQPSETEITSARLKTLFDDMNGGVSVVVYEDNGAVRLAYVNDRYYSLFGYTKKQFMEELKSPHDTTYPDDRDAVAKRFAEAKAMKQATTFRYRVVKRDKSIAYIRCNLSFTTIDGVSGYVLI